MKLEEKYMHAWDGFVLGEWTDKIDVRSFIIKNYTLYEGNDEFLTGPTAATNELWSQCEKLYELEAKAGGVLEMDTDIIQTITSHGPGYLNKDLEKIVGFQTDKPFKRGLQVFGGIKMAQAAAHAYGYEIDPHIVETFTKYRKTHNQGVFDVYNKDMRAARSSGIITGLPDAYGRGRIIGDYRRVALYGVDYLIAEKQHVFENMAMVMTDKRIKKREEFSEQIKALFALKEMAASYGFDISGPATTAQEAIQWLYFGYLAAVKDQNGAAMSIGRTSTFIDIYIERDFERGILTEEQAQELMDHFVMKLRLVKFLRTPEYNDLFSGDPTWVTESIGGIGYCGKPLVTKNSFRVLNSLFNIGPAPEPNLTVLWSKNLPHEFKKFCAKVSIETSAVQYENDDIMIKEYGDDYAIACCVSAMRIGKQMQFFGARANLAKCLLYALNGGADEKSGKQIAPLFRKVSADENTPLDYEEVMKLYDNMMLWLSELYINTLNVIHFMHDKYSYESLQMALHDERILRTMATGIAGLSVVADSLSAIKYAKVYPIYNEDKTLIVDFKVEGDYPKYGNNDDNVDKIAINVVETFMDHLRKHPTYRNSKTTMSVLTITSNVVYGKKTGNTPDGRKTGEPFAPGANPMHERDEMGALASLASVAKIPYRDAQDGISNTFSVVPDALGKE